MPAKPQASSTPITPALPVTPWANLPKALLAAGLLSIIGLFAIATPDGLLDKLDFIGFAICHRMPERSFFIDGHQLPLCARCTGQYLGMLTGALVLVLRRRTRAARMPSRPIVATLIGFIVIMGIDGVNSTISIIPGAPQLWHTTNFMRIVTGVLYGLAISALFPPFFNSAVWAEPSGEPTIRNWRELGTMLVGAAVVVAVVLSLADWLLYPVAIVTIGGALVLLSLLNSVIMLSARKLENMLSQWRQMALPMLFGLAMGLLEITALITLRVLPL